MPLSLTRVLQLQSTLRPDIPHTPYLILAKRDRSNHQTFLVLIKVIALLGLIFPALSWSAPQLPDTLEKRAAACTICHGEHGKATNDGYYPRIAGKPAGYLYNQLINFKEGRRQNAMMYYMIRYLSDAYLRELAIYFANQHPPYPAPAPLSVQPSQLSRGRTLVLEGDQTKHIPACISCHGTALMGVAPDIPGLLGLPRDYLSAQLSSWKNGVRHAQEPDCMAHIDQHLSGDDLSAVTAWLASQPIPNNQTIPVIASENFKRTMPLPCGSLLHHGKEP